MIVVTLGTFIDNSLKYLNYVNNGEDVEIVMNKDKKIKLELVDETKNSK